VLAAVQESTIGGVLNSGTLATETAEDSTRQQIAAPSLARNVTPVRCAVLLERDWWLVPARKPLAVVQYLAEVDLRVLRALRFQTYSPGPSDPDFDLAWCDGDTIIVAEVKSLTERNERGQLRLGLSQVLDYEQTIQQAGMSVSSVLCVERPPADAAYWLELCTHLGVWLIWPPSFGA
jgi:hypothetical protein